ncbi:hypothetical protein SAY87_002902 [Trapa incisa]|uniref:Uncharacterized protein n=1 Tax=Trapa incisa TaxID=236973 RepID=A0AAN7QH03_9MYRT|nr:hypothetical protein SAY87_002902 [Trapa incisa]
MVWSTGLSGPSDDPLRVPSPHAGQPVQVLMGPLGGNGASNCGAVNGSMWFACFGGLCRTVSIRY